MSGKADVYYYLMGILGFLVLSLGASSTLGGLHLKDLLSENYPWGLYTQCLCLERKYPSTKYK